MNGFARTLTRLEELEEPLPRYLQMMATASDQMGELLDDLGVVARIESGRWETSTREADTLELAQRAAGRVEIAPVDVTGTGGRAAVEPDATERALAGLARCAVRHGGLERLAMRVNGVEISIGPVTDDSAAVLVGESLRDFGAAVAGRVVEALGGSVAVDGEALVGAPPRRVGLERLGRRDRAEGGAEVAGAHGVGGAARADDAGTARHQLVQARVVEALRPRRCDERRELGVGLPVAAELPPGVDVLTVLAADADELARPAPGVDAGGLLAETGGEPGGGEGVRHPGS